MPSQSDSFPASVPLLHESVPADQGYRSVLNSLPEVVFQTDGDGRWPLLNTAWTQDPGYSIDETLGRPDAEHLHPDDYVLHRKMVDQLLSGRAPVPPYNVRLRTRDGQIRWLEVRLW